MLARWFNCLILGFITLLNFSAATAVAAEKKNICAMTINSNDEIELFKKHLSKDHFNFIELTENVAENSTQENSWLAESCKKGITCDVLVISGHFGGSFFGESGISLPLETLETASCDSSCSGILHKPKEVFLFGCNTLAGKEKDSRTPEQYAAVLQQDGFSMEQAQQIAAFRYSPIGSSFNDRMSRIFSKVPRIYGFSSIAPSGKNIAPHLKGYLKETAPTYFDQLTTMTADSNTLLKGRLKGQPFVQTKGANDSRSPVCYIRDEKTSTIAKLKYTLQVLEKGGALELAPYLSQYFANLDEKKLNPAERRLLEDIYEHEAGREKLAAFVSKPIAGLLKAQVDTLNLMLNINWISEKNYDKNMASLVLQPLYNGAPLKREIIDQLCSLNASVKNINPQMIKSEHWKNKDFYQILRCLKPQNTEMMDAVYSELIELEKNIGEKNSKETDLASLMISILSHARYIKPQYTEAVGSLLRNQYLTGAIASYANSLSVLDKKFRTSVEDVVSKMPKTSLNADVLKTALLGMSFGDDAYLDAALEGYFDSTSELFTQPGLFALVLKRSEFANDKLQAEVYKEDSGERLARALKLLGKVTLTAPLKKRLMSIATSSNYTANAQLLALNLLSSTAENPEAYLADLKQVIDGKGAFVTRRAALGNYIGYASENKMKDSLLKIFETETNPQVLKSLQVGLLEAESPKNYDEAPFHRHLAHPHIKLDTKSQLLQDLQSGKIPFFIDSKAHTDVKGLLVRDIYIGKMDSGYSHAARSIGTRVVYDNQTKSILGLLSDHDLAAYEHLAKVRDLYTISAFNRGATLVTGAITIDPVTRKIDQDYTDSLMQEQLKLIASLKARDKKYEKTLENNSVLTLNIVASGNGEYYLTLESSADVPGLNAMATAVFTPGANGVGTVQLKNVQVTTGQ